MAWTADDLVAAVRRRAQLPDASADGALGDADILELATEELSMRLVPLVRRSRGDYYVTTYDVDITADVASYRVPERAQTSGLREVTLVDSAGAEVPIPQMHLEDAGPSDIVGGGLRFYMQGADVVLVPTPTVSGYTLRMRYHRSHAALVPVAQSGIVTSLSGDVLALKVAATGISGEALPPVPSTWGVDYQIDAYHRFPPFGPVALDMLVLSVDDSNPSVDVYTIVDGVPAAMLSTVYYMASISGETSIVDLPRECWPLLVSAVTARVCDVIGDRDAAQMSYALYERESTNIMELLTPRVEGNKQVVIDRYSPLRSGRGRWR